MKSKIRFTLGTRIGLGFGVLIILVIVILTITYRTLDDSIRQNEKITNINNPSLTSLEELKLLSYRAKMLITAWVSNQSGLDHPDKKKFLRLVKNEAPDLEKRIEELSTYWDKKEIKQMEEIFKLFSELVEAYKEVTGYLDSFESYDDPEKKFYAEFMTEQDGLIAVLNDKMIEQLNDLIRLKKGFFNKNILKMLSSFSNLKLLFKYLGVFLLLGGIVITVLTTRSIVVPINHLKETLLRLSRGNFANTAMKETNDEIGEMASALNKVVLGLKRTKDFAEQIGDGNFSTEYTPLSEDDDLGYALISMRSDLEKNEKELERKVEERTAEVVLQKEEIEKQTKKIRTLLDDLTGSIRYAKRLQEAIFPSLVTLEGIDNFILFRPKDIVSGDFYWTAKKGDDIYIAAVDCTGHGVPGAFMSILGNSSLNEGLVKYKETFRIMDYVNKAISDSLNSQDQEVRMKDGMDMALCRYNTASKILYYSGANNPLYLIRDKEVIQYTPDKMAIGSYAENKDFRYQSIEVRVQPSDSIYIFSDGYADQFGGPKNKKFKYKQFREKLIEHSSKTFEAQREALNKDIIDWMEASNQEQIDDILVIGFSPQS